MLRWLGHIERMNGNPAPKQVERKGKTENCETLMKKIRCMKWLRYRYAASNDSLKGQGSIMRYIANVLV